MPDPLDIHSAVEAAARARYFRDQGSSDPWQQFPSWNEEGVAERYRSLVRADVTVAFTALEIIFRERIGDEISDYADQLERAGVANADLIREVADMVRHSADPTASIGRVEPISGVAEAWLGTGDTPMPEPKRPNPGIDERGKPVRPD